MESIFWLGISYVAGSVITGYMVMQSRNVKIVEEILDKLIADGYLKTTGVGRNMEIIKHTDWKEYE